MQKVPRLHRELQQMKQNPVPGIQFWPKDEAKMDTFCASIQGPKDTPYVNGIFRLEIEIPSNYPFMPPLVKFITPIYHPNIDESGSVCLNLLAPPPKGSWTPLISLENLLISVQQLMANPNPEDPVRIEIADEFLNDRSLFESKAKEWTFKHASH